MLKTFLFALKGVGYSAFNPPLQGAGTHTSLLPLGKSTLVLVVNFLNYWFSSRCGFLWWHQYWFSPCQWWWLCQKKKSWIIINALQSKNGYAIKQKNHFHIHQSIQQLQYPNSFPNQLMFTALETKICETDSPPSDWRNLSSCLWFSFATFIGESVMRWTPGLIVSVWMYFS